ncbi:NAD(+) diphosphatase [Microbacterium sp. NPDC078428]|uniref:NAD(+) diphosphatase n=1 Tax=Microbacterium sp. NPDC078428 TaxID=3364190 RepID=UPI0037C71D11
MTLQRAAGAVPAPRVPLSRVAEERAEPDVIARALRSPGTRVLRLREGKADVGAGDALVLVGPGEIAPGDAVALLGRGEDGGMILLALEEGHAPEGWAELRALGGALPAADTALLTEARALGRWISESRYCPACGAETELRQAGWARHCPGCSREHFPRTDPAVIVAVTDGERLLLGSNAAWGPGRYSCFAGFVEAGESAEEALVREIEEESGILVSDIEYVGSQAWPYPRSLMLGFLARTDDAGTARPDGTEIVDVRWFTADQIGLALAGEGEIGLPGPASISRGLIERWHARASADA